jgi:hypothetical protein
VISILLVPESSLDDMRRYAGLQEQDRARVAEPVELDRPHAGRLDQLGVLPLSEVVGLERLAEGVPPPREVTPLLREQWPGRSLGAKRTVKSASEPV